MSNPPEVTIWLDIPDDCRMSAEYTGDGDVQVTIGNWSNGQTLMFEPEALHRFVALASEILALPEPSDPKVDRPRLQSPAA